MRMRKKKNKHSSINKIKILNLKGKIKVIIL